jgi:two-component system, LytTR family, sensor kinase
MSDQERYQRARARVRQRRILYVHAVIYVCVNVFLLISNLITNPSTLWFYWPLIGWGIALAVQAIFVYGLLGAGALLGPTWEEKEIQKSIEKERISEHAPVP